MGKKLLIGLILTLVIIVFFPAYGITEPSRQKAAAQRQLEKSAERGAETYLAICSSCHGAQGEGSIGPSVNNTRLNREVLKEVISKGRPSRPVAMPAWGQASGGPLKEHQIEDVVNFIKHWPPHLLKKAQEKHGGPASAPVTAPAPAEQDLSEGKKLYASMGCNACHGQDARGTSFAPGILGKSLEEITRQVRNPRTVAMPALPPDRLSEADLKKIAAFIASLGK